MSKIGFAIVVGLTCVACFGNAEQVDEVSSSGGEKTSTGVCQTNPPNFSCEKCEVFACDMDDGTIEWRTSNGDVFSCPDEYVKTPDYEGHVCGESSVWLAMDACGCLGE